MSEHIKSRQQAANWAAKLLAKGHFYVLDTETTGTGKSDEVIQIGIIDAAGEVALETLVKPGRKIPPASTLVHGITDTQVTDAPTFRAMYVTLSSLLAGETVVAYNADFDRRLLEQTAQRYGLPSLRVQSWQCAMKWYAKYYGRSMGRGRYRWFKLADACHHQGVPVVDAHSAVGDCQMTLSLLRKMASLD